MKTKRRFTKQLLSIVLCLTMLFGSVPTAVIATEGTDPACYCAEKCGEGSVNEWCDVCRFDFAACAASEEEKAAVYAAHTTTAKVADLTYTVSLTITDYHTVLYMRELSVMSSNRKNGEITLEVKISAIMEGPDGSSGLADHLLGFYTFKDDNCTVPVNAALDVSTQNITGVLTITRDASSHTGHDCVKKKCSSCGRDYEAPCDYSALESRRLPDGSGEHRYVCSKNASHSPKDWEKCYHPAQSCTDEYWCQTCEQKFISPDSHSWHSISIIDPRTGKPVLAYYTTNNPADYTFDHRVYHRRWCDECGHYELSEHEFDQQATCVDMAVCDLCYRWHMGDHSWFLAPHPEKPMEEHGEQCRHCKEYVSLDSDKAAHTWENGICTACEFVCGHEWENGACAFCGTTCNHNFDRETYKCTVCGLDCAHSFDGGICTECGYYCKHDWDHNKYQYYSVCNYCDLLCGHSYHESYRVEATCSAEGVIGYKCAFCTSVKTEVLEALKHDYVWSYTDTTHEGYCKVGKETKTGFHKYSREYFDATCTEDGYYTDICTECGYSKKTVTSTKLNHYGGEATCKELALCERCGEPYGEFGDHVGGEATCTVQARCEVCGEGYGKLKSHEADSDDFDCTTPVRCYYCDAVMKEGNATHNWDENNFCSNENCQETKGFTFTFTYGDEVLFVRNVHTGTFYTFEGFEERDGLTLVGWEADEDADEDGKPDFYPVGDYTYVDGDLSFNAVYKLMYTVRFITYDIWEGAYTESYNPIVGEAGQTVILWDDASSYYKFLGWAKEEGGEVIFQANEEITLTENLTLYGVIRPYQATFDLGEGAVWNDENGDPITVLEGNFSGDWIEIRKFPVRPGYIFKGFVDQTEWFWEPWQDEDTGEWIVDFYFDRADLEMTAVWEECTGIYGVNLILEQKIGLRLWLNKAEVDAIGNDFTYAITCDGKTLAGGTYSDLTAKAEVKKQGETDYYTLVLGGLEPAAFHKAITFEGDGLDPAIYSINDILSIVITNKNSAFGEGFVTLAKSLWNYGIEAYDRFSGKTSELAKETISAPTDANVVASATDGNVSDAKIAGRALVLREAVGLRIYLNLQNGVKAEDLTFILNGTELGEELLEIREENGNGYNASVTLYVSAKAMDRTLNVSITKGDEKVGSYSDSIASICQQYREACGVDADLCTAILRYIQAVPGMND